MTVNHAVPSTQGYTGLYLMLVVLCLHLQHTPADLTACSANDVVFLIDTSESMIENDPYGKPYHYWKLAKNFLYKVIDDFDIWPDRTRVALVAFNSGVTPLTYLGGYPDGYTTKEDTLKALMNLQHQGGITKTELALWAAKDMFQQHPRANAKKVIVIVTDGLTSLSGVTIIDHQIPYFGSEYSVFAVAVSRYIDEEEMQYYTSDPPEKHIIHLDDQSMLDHITTLTTFRVCDLPDPEGPGTKCRVNNCEVCYSPAICARCEKGYYWSTGVRDCKACRVKTDLVFVLDNSGSINAHNDNNYAILKDFVKSVVDTLDIGLDATRVAAIRFATETYIEFYLSTYSTKQMVKDAITLIPYGTGGTHTHLAMTTLRDSILRADEGDRAEVRNVVILLTDGQTNDGLPSPVPVAQELHKAGVVFFVVGITDDVNEAELRQIATKPLSEHYYKTPDITHLRTLKNSLVKHVCVDQRLPTGNCTDPNSCEGPNIYVQEEANRNKEKNGATCFSCSYLAELVVLLIYITIQKSCGTL